ncbi:MAG: tetratricopeptide repeat protein [Desulfuromonas sp.]|nr:tetratricopeptide repeat protein [Desulfuromonas sp.]
MTLMSFLLIVIVFLAFFVFFSGINPQEMTIFFTPEQSVTYPVTVIVLGCVIVGLFIGYGIHLYGNFSHVLRCWIRGRDEKRDKEINETYREGVGRLLSGDIKRAHSVLQKVIDKDPNKIEGYIAMASVLAQEGNNKETISMLRQAKSIDGKSLEVLFKLADTYEKLGQDDAACVEYDEILEHDRGNRKAMRKQRDLHMKHERWDNALEFQARLLKAGISSNRIQEEKQLMLSIRYEIAKQSLAAANTEQAIVALKQIIKEDGTFTAAIVTLGDAYVQNGNDVDAAKVWQDGYQKLERSVFLSRLENLYIENEDPQSLLSFYNKALTQNKSDLVLHFFYAKLCLRLEMVDEAMEQIYMVENSAPDFPQLHILLAEAHRRRDRTEEAIDEYQKALGVDIQINLGYVCDTCGHGAREWNSRCPECGTWGSFSIVFRKAVANRTVVEPAPTPRGA